MKCAGVRVLLSQVVYIAPLNEALIRLQTGFQGECKT
jgi:hypothetical protein